MVTNVVVRVSNGLAGTAAAGCGISTIKREIAPGPIPVLYPAAERRKTLILAADLA